MSELRTNRIIPRDGLPAGSAGGIIQVKQTIQNAVYTQSLSSNTDSNSCGLDVTITPTRSDSKILVSCHANTSCSIDDTTGVTLYVNGSLNTESLGAADGSRGRCITAAFGNSTGGMTGICSFQYLHSPASTSAQTYSVRLRYFSGASGSVYLNRVQSDDNAQYRPRMASFITVMELSG